MNIAIFTANRAERGLLQPVYDAINKRPIIRAYWAALDVTAIPRYQLATAITQTANILRSDPIDFAIVPCDRVEMVGAALYLFYNNIPFAQLHAGDTGSGVHDEVGRWIISRCASLHFTNSPESAQNLLKNGEESWRIHLVGSTAFDDLVIDETLCPRAPFSLVLIHPDTYSEQATMDDLGQTKSKLTIFLPPFPSSLPQYVIIGPNKDKHHDLIQDTWDFYVRHYPQQIIYYETVSRSAFLGLMKNCKEFITNSSSALYELPYFNIGKYVPIGKRNADRKPLEKIETGGSERIADILSQWANRSSEDMTRLLRKHFTV